MIRVLLIALLSIAVAACDGEIDGVAIGPDALVQRSDAGVSHDADTRDSAESQDAETRDSAESQDADTRDSAESQDAETRDSGESRDADTRDSGGGHDAGRPDSGRCSLRRSGAITARADDEVIEDVRIEVQTGPAIRVEGHARVVIRRCEILHGAGPGILFRNAPNLRIEDCSITHTGAPATGANADEDRNNIEGESSADVTIERVRLIRGSSGIYLLSSPRAKMRFIEGHDFRGPIPRGQLVQLNRSNSSVLEDFSCENGPTSWPEDNVSVFQSSNVTVRRGLVDGNNSPSGVGVMFEQSDGRTNGGLCEDVDAIRQGNGAFAGYPARGVTFRRTRARENICTDQGRGAPLSNALVWAGSPDSVDLRIEDSRYFALCNPNNRVWDSTVFTTVQISSEDFAPRAPIRLLLCFDPL